MGIDLASGVDQAVKDLPPDIKLASDAIHGVLDRLNGTKLIFTVGGIQLVIPERK